MATLVPEPAADDAAVVALLASASRTAGGTGSGVLVASGWSYLLLELVCSALGSVGNLDVYVQQSVDGGYNWDDVAHYATLGAAGPGAAQVVTVPRRVETAAREIHTMLDATLGAGSVVGSGVYVGPRLRAKWTISGGTWVFQVLAYALP